MAAWNPYRSGGRGQAPPPAAGEPPMPPLPRPGSMDPDFLDRSEMGMALRTPMDQDFQDRAEMGMALREPMNPAFVQAAEAGLAARGQLLSGIQNHPGLTPAWKQYLMQNPDLAADMLGWGAQGGSGRAPLPAHASGGRVGSRPAASPSKKKVEPHKTAAPSKKQPPSKTTTRPTTTKPSTVTHGGRTTTTSRTTTTKGGGSTSGGRSGGSGGGRRGR